MAINFAKPVTTDTYSDVLATIRDNITAILTGDMTGAANIPNAALKWNNADSTFQDYTGGSWSTKYPRADAYRIKGQLIDASLFASGMAPMYAGGQFVGQSLRGGWIEFPSAEVIPQYNSTTSMILDSTTAPMFAVGARVRWKQGGGYKYGTVKSVVASSIVLDATTDYSVANSAITDLAVSYIAKPIGFPAFFGYSLTAYGKDSMNVTNPVTLTYARYLRDGHWMDAVVNFTTTISGTASNAVGFNLPANARDNGVMVGTTYLYLNSVSEINGFAQVYGDVSRAMAFKFDRSNVTHVDSRAYNVIAQLRYLTAD